MKLLMRVHRYLSCVAAPAMIFFAISGGWQAFRLQENAKDGSYHAPKILETLSHVHKAERLVATAAPWFRAAQVALAAIFLLTAIAGLIMAFKLTKPVWLAWAAVLAGIVLPVVLALASMK